MIGIPRSWFAANVRDWRIVTRNSRQQARPVVAWGEARSPRLRFTNKSIRHVRAARGTSISSASCFALSGLGSTIGTYNPGRRSFHFACPGLSSFGLSALRRLGLSVLSAKWTTMLARDWDTTDCPAALVWARAGRVSAPRWCGWRRRRAGCGSSGSLGKTRARWSRIVE